jgi:hypothetical protein
MYHIRRQLEHFLQDEILGGHLGPRHEFRTRSRVLMVGSHWIIDIGFNSCWCRDDDEGSVWNFWAAVIQISRISALVYYSDRISYSCSLPLVQAAAIFCGGVVQVMLKR